MELEVRHPRNMQFHCRYDQDDSWTGNVSVAIVFISRSFGLTILSSDHSAEGGGVVFDTFTFFSQVLSLALRETVYRKAPYMSRTQVLLTKIAKLFSEIGDIETENKSNKYSSKLPESKKKPQNSHKLAVSDTYDEHALHAPEPYDSIPNPQSHLSYSPNKHQEHEAPHAYKLPARMPDLLNPSRISSPDPEDPTISPSELPVSGSRGSMSEPEPSFAEKNGVGSDEDRTD